MKNVIQLMESSCGSYVKKCLLCFLFIGVLEFLYCYMQVKDIVYLDMRNILLSEVFLIGSMVCVGLLIWFNYTRVKRFVESGGFSRIRLLPISSKAYMYSELLLAFIGVILLVMVQYGMVLLFLLSVKSSYVFETNAMFYAILTTDVWKQFVILPSQLPNLIFLLLSFVYCLMILVNTCVKEDKGGNIAVGCLMLFFVTTVMVFDVSFLHGWYVYLLIDLIAHWYVNKYFDMRRVSS